MEIYSVSPGKEASKTTEEMLPSLLLCAGVALGEFWGWMEPRSMQTHPDSHAAPVLDMLVLTGLWSPLKPQLRCPSTVDAALIQFTPQLLAHTVWGVADPTAEPQR